MIDLDGIPENQVFKFITRKFIVEDVDSLQIKNATSDIAWFDHKFETPISKRVKSKWFAGFIISEEKNNNVEFDEVISNLVNIIKRVNIQNINEDVFSKEEILTINNIIQGVGEIDPKNLLWIASKACNYNFFDENLKENDLIKGMSNFVKLPTYNRNQDLIWPKRVDHEEVKKIIEEKQETSEK